MKSAVNEGMTIKVGDKVRVVNPDDKYNGLVGTATFYGLTHKYLVFFATVACSCWYKHSELELSERNQEYAVELPEAMLSLTSESNSKGQQSHLDARYDLIPPIALKTVAEVLGEGESKYPTIDGVPNWHYITTRDHLNHALAHIYAYLRGDDTGEDDLAHATTRLLLALEIDRIGVKEK